MSIPVPRLCYITDRLSLPSERPALTIVQMAAEAGVDLIQIREKDLPIRELISLVNSVLDVTRGTGTRVVVNDRLDAALAAGAGGVHLGTESMPAAKVRAAFDPQGQRTFCLGVSCHSVDDARAAEEAGADYVVVGPVFDTPSKRVYGPPLGLGILSEAVRTCEIPVLALGGITPERVRACIEAGASGIAGISIFQRENISVAQLQELRREIVETAAH